MYPADDVEVRLRLLTQEVRRLRERLEAGLERERERRAVHEERRRELVPAGEPEWID
jgi:hypothetical protein